MAKRVAKYYDAVCEIERTDEFRADAPLMANRTRPTSMQTMIVIRNRYSLAAASAVDASIAGGTRSADGPNKRSNAFG